MNNCYERLEQNHWLDTLFIDQLRITLITRMFILTIYAFKIKERGKHVSWLCWPSKVHLITMKSSKVSASPPCMWHRSLRVQPQPFSTWVLGSDLWVKCSPQVVRWGDLTAFPGIWTPEFLICEALLTATALSSQFSTKLSHYTEVHSSRRCTRTSWKCFVGGASPSWKNSCGWEAWGSPLIWETPPAVSQDSWLPLYQSPGTAGTAPLLKRSKSTGIIHPLVQGSLSERVGRHLCAYLGSCPKNCCRN